MPKQQQTETEAFVEQRRAEEKMSNHKYQPSQIKGGARLCLVCSKPKASHMSKPNDNQEQDEQQLAGALLRDLCDGKGWDQEAWAKRKAPRPAEQPQGNRDLSRFSNERTIELLLQQRDALQAQLGNLQKAYEQMSGARFNLQAQLTLAEQTKGELLAALGGVMGEMASRFDYETATPEEEAAFCKAEAAIARATEGRAG